MDLIDYFLFHVGEIFNPGACERAGEQSPYGEEAELGNVHTMQERFNKDLEEIKKSQYILNNAINEIKNTLEATNSRITEAEDRISELEDRMVEINESERIKEKRIKRNESR